MSGAPDPKSRSLARGERRYRRKVASSKQWQAIIAAKLGPCRVVPLHRGCHNAVTHRSPRALHSLAESLSDAEYAYVIGKLGEGGMERLFGVAAR